MRPFGTVMIFHVAGYVVAGVAEIASPRSFRSFELGENLFVGAIDDMGDRTRDDRDAPYR